MKRGLNIFQGLFLLGLLLKRLGDHFTWFEVFMPLIFDYAFYVFWEYCKLIKYDQRLQVKVLNLYIKFIQYRGAIKAKRKIAKIVREAK
jgi:hypothetical protein